MNNLVILFLIVVTTCCSDQVVDYDQLKLEGYIEANCNTIDSYKKNNRRYIEFNKHFDSINTFLIARCFDETNCSFSITEESKITCQRYSYDDSSEDKRDHLNDKYKEFKNHSILYLSL